MKKAVTIALLLIISLQTNAQVKNECLPKKLIVVAENLNFRSEPNTNKKPIDKFTNSELLTFLGIKRIKKDHYWTGFANSWIKVRRDLTGEEGYVLGKYLRPQENAYVNYYDENRLQKGNWYGIYEEAGIVKIEKANPKIIPSGYEDIHSIVSLYKHKLIICSQQEITTGKIIGKLHVGFNKDLHIETGQQKPLIQIGDFEFSLISKEATRTVDGNTFKINGELILIKKNITGSSEHFSQQNLSNCIEQYGEGFYQIDFVGDLNNDGIPELIISEGTTHLGMTYYFKSNEKGELILQSTSGISSKC